MRNKNLKFQTLCSDIHKELKEKQLLMDEKRREFNEEWEKTHRSTVQKKPPKLP
jgi:hypothetical protein